MSRFSFQNYGERARTVDDATQASARLLITKEQERRIVADVVQKLDIQPTDKVLDLGCGIGQIGIPLSFMVESYTGIDHPDVVARFGSRFKGDNITLIGQNFLDVELEQNYTKVLMYSVAHYLNAQELPQFISKAVNALEPEGRMLIGDMPNIDLRNRFFGSGFGIFFDRWWVSRFNEAIPAEIAAIAESPSSYIKDGDVIAPDDQFVLNLCGGIRRAGLSCYILPQPRDLPMWFQREDLLVINP